MVGKLIPIVISVYILITLAGLVGNGGWTVFGIDLAPLLSIATILAILTVVLFYIKNAF